MPMLRFRRAIALALCALLAVAAQAQPNHVYLTWQGDTSTTMTVNFHTPAQAESVVRYGEVGSEPTQEATGASHQIPGVPDGRYIHAVELKNLKPGTRYVAEVAEKKIQFRTLPNDGSSIRGIFGGDLGIFPLEEQVLQAAAKQNADVAVLGGDIAYDNGDLKNFKMWDIWLSRWEKIMVRDNGDLIPMIHAIGNHEVNKSESSDPAERAPTYLGLFAQGGKSYFTRDLGPNAHVIVLDTGHLVPHADQVDFLRGALQAAEKRPFTFAVYHVPQFPSHRKYEDPRSENARVLWQPLFDEFNLSIGFEHHDHTFKRTKPIRAGKVDSAGTTYLGDGSMGVLVRSIDNQGAWYLEKAESKAHVWVVDIARDKVHCTAVDHLGVVFDEVSFAPRPQAAN